MLKLLLGDPNTRKLKRYQPIVEEINLLEEEVSILTDDELRNETQNLKSQVSLESNIKRQKEQLEEILPKIVDLSPKGIIEKLGLRRPIYKRTAAYGHFGRTPEIDGGFSWEKTDLIDLLTKYF